jgi:alpha/beta hydrolase fold
MRARRCLPRLSAEEDSRDLQSSSSSLSPEAEAVKRSLSFWPTVTEWEDILPALARHYAVVAPDLPGPGGSDAPASAADYRKKAMAADIYGLMVKLGLSHHIRIVGHEHPGLWWFGLFSKPFDLAYNMMAGKEKVTGPLIRTGACPRPAANSTSVTTGLRGRLPDGWLTPSSGGS